MNKKQNSNNAYNQQLNISGVINHLFDLERFNIDPQWNGEFIELEKQIEVDGEFVRWEDVRNLITNIHISNDL